MIINMYSYHNLNINSVKPENIINKENHFQNNSSQEINRVIETRKSAIFSSADGTVFVKGEEKKLSLIPKR